MNVLIMIGLRFANWCFEKECWRPIIAAIVPRTRRTITTEVTDKSFTPGPLPDRTSNS